MCCNCSFFSSIDLSDWISIFSVIINSLLAIWIISTVQNKLTNKRVLKDHLINELKDIRIEYRSFLNQLYSNKLRPKQITPWFKLMNIKINDLISLIENKHKIDNKILNPYQIELRDLITELKEFIKCYKNNDLITLKEKSQNKVISFQQKNNHLFNDLIVKINDEN